SLPRLLGAQREPPREPAKPEAPEASEVVEASTSRELRRELLEVLSNPNIRSIATKYYQAQLPKKSRLGFRDLRQVLKALNEHLGLPLPTAAAAEQLFKRYDFNGDGDLSFEEFFELFVTSLRRAAFDRSVLLGREIFVTQEPGKVWEIYHRVKTLGEGSFGTAHLAKHKRTKEDRVVKTVEKSKAKLPIEDIEKEIMVLRQLASSPEHFQPVAAMADRKAVIKNADMAEDMQQDAIDCATQALEKYNIEKDIAAFMKKEFDKKYNPTWHCVVGRNFGSYVTHETKHFIYFYLGQVAILLFKCLGNIYIYILRLHGSL
ncbi:Dynein light chain 2, partial [Durusdinium trenchii]